METAFRDDQLLQQDLVQQSAEATLTRLINQVNEDNPELRRYARVVIERDIPAYGSDPGAKTGEIHFLPVEPRPPASGRHNQPDHQSQRAESLAETHARMIKQVNQNSPGLREPVRVVTGRAAVTGTPTAQTATRSQAPEATQPRLVRPYVLQYRSKPHDTVEMPLVSARDQLPTVGKDSEPGYQSQQSEAAAKAMLARLVEKVNAQDHKLKMTAPVLTDQDTGQQYTRPTSATGEDPLRVSFDTSLKTLTRLEAGLKKQRYGVQTDTIGTPVMPEPRPVGESFARVIARPGEPASVDRSYIPQTVENAPAPLEADTVITPTEITVSQPERPQTPLQETRPIITFGDGARSLSDDELEKRMKDLMAIDEAEINRLDRDNRRNESIIRRMTGNFFRRLGVLTTGSTVVYGALEVFNAHIVR